MVRDLLIEIGTEEIPAVEIDEAIESFCELFKVSLKNNGFDFGEIKKFSTPRRLSLIIYNLEEKQKDKEVEIKGPPASSAIKDGKLTEQGEKFLKSKGISKGDYFVRKTDKGEFLFGRKIEKGLTIDEFLIANLKKILSSIGFKKLMRWDDSGILFSRPIRWIICLYGDRLINLEIGKIISSNKTYGHRFLSKGAIVIKNVDEYEKKLRENFVIPSKEERREIIIKLLNEAGEKLGGRIVLKEDLIEEVKNLVEYPQMVIGEIKEEFLSLPKEVIETAMESHQRYFPVERDGKLLPFFVSIINTIPNDEIKKNNENVLIARLEDAKFYYQEDRKIRFENRYNMLDDITYQEGFGSIKDKIERMKKLIDFLKVKINFDFEKTLKALNLCKLDLTTLMIRDGKEFTGLEGIIGYYYAVENGIDKDLAEIIREHYLPRSFDDELPERIESAIIGIIDRLDIIYIGFLKGLKPTGSKDPLGLKNSANGIISLLLHFKIKLPIEELLEILGNIFKNTEPIEDIKFFFNERMERYFERLGIPYDITDAVLKTDANEVYKALRKAKELMKFKEKKEYEKLIISQKRVSNILRGLEVKGEPDEGLFCEEEEKRLFEESKRVEKDVVRYLEKEEYDSVLKTLLNLQVFIDQFFDKVLVMHKDERLKINRLRLLNFIREIFLKYADFSLIVLEGEKDDKRNNNK